MSKSWYRELPLVMQPIDGKNWVCTAACLSMVFQSAPFALLRLPHEIEEISKHILVSRPGLSEQTYCDNLLTLKYILELGLPAALISVVEPLASLQASQRKSIEAILSLRYSPYDGSHTVVFSFMNRKSIFVNDPMPAGDSPEIANINKEIPISRLSQMTSRLGPYDQEIIYPNTMLVIIPPASRESTVTRKCFLCHNEIILPESFSRQCRYILCPHNHPIGVPNWVELNKCK